MEDLHIFEDKKEAGNFLTFLSVHVFDRGQREEGLSDCRERDELYIFVFGRVEV